VLRLRLCLRVSLAWATAHLPLSLATCSISAAGAVFIILVTLYPRSLLFSLVFNKWIICAIMQDSKQLYLNTPFTRVLFTRVGTCRRLRARMIVSASGFNDRASEISSSETVSTTPVLDKCSVSRFSRSDKCSVLRMGWLCCADMKTSIADTIIKRQIWNRGIRTYGHRPYNTLPAILFMFCWL